MPQDVASQHRIDLSEALEANPIGPLVAQAVNIIACMARPWLDRRQRQGIGRI